MGVNTDEFSYLVELCKKAEQWDYIVIAYPDSRVPVIDIQRDRDLTISVFSVRWKPATDSWVLETGAYTYASHDGEIQNCMCSLTTNADVVKLLQTAIVKARHRFSVPVEPITARGAFSYDPVPGEPDYVEQSV